MTTYKFFPGARHAPARGGWFPLVQVFRDNKPVGAKYAKAPLPTREDARRQARQIARDVAARMRHEFTGEPINWVVAAPQPQA